MEGAGNSVNKVRREVGKNKILYVILAGLTY